MQSASAPARLRGKRKMMFIALILRLSEIIFKVNSHESFFYERFQSKYLVPRVSSFTTRKPCNEIPRC